MKDEIFKPIFIHGEPTRYFVGCNGTIKNINGDIIKQHITRRGYLAAYLYHNKKSYHLVVHKLVATAFVENPSNKPYVNHKDGNKVNPCAYNLEWVTSSENTKHAYDTGLISKTKHSISVSKYDIDDIHKVCQLISEGNHTFQQIKSITGIGINTIKAIYARRQWTHISSNYNFDKYQRKFHDDATIYKVCELLESGSFSVSEIAKMTCTNTSLVYNILKRKCYCTFSEDYDFSMYNMVKKQNRITYDQIINVCILLDTTTLRLNKIAEITKVPKYTVSKILNRIQWQTISNDYSFKNRNTTHTMEKGSTTIENNDDYYIIEIN